MPIIEAINKTFVQISTSIGLLKPNAEAIRTQFDLIPKSTIEELEGLRSINLIDYSILEDPDIPDRFEADAYVPLIGGPTTGDFSGVVPVISSTTRIADALQAYGEFNAAIAPVKPGTLVGQDLNQVGTTLFSAIIPSGLSAAWNPLTPGQTITNLIVDGIFIFESPDQANRFIAGTETGGQATAGSLDLIEDGVISETYDIVINGLGIIGRIIITDISVFNVIWQKINAEFVIALTTEGRHRFSMQHTESGLSNEFEAFFDNVNTAPVFSAVMSATINTVVSKFLSGIEALGLNSTVDIAYTAASGIFEKAFHPSAVGQVAGPGHATSNDNPGITPAVLDTFPVSRTIILGIVSQSALVPQYTATIKKPNGDNVSSNDTIAQPVNTFGTISTGKIDDFFDEARRIVLNSGTSSGTATAFTSSSALVNGNAQQRHNGTLQFPDSTDYPGFTGDQEYQRFIDKVAASAGALTFTGILFSDIDPFGTGDLNVILELATQAKFFDLGRPIGSNNGTGSGNSRVNSIGARNDSLSSSSTLAWSIGTDSTSFNTNEYRLIIIFRNTNHSITKISEV